MIRLRYGALLVCFGLLPDFSVLAKSIYITNKTPFYVFANGMVAAGISANPIKPKAGTAKLITKQDSVLHLLLKKPHSRDYADNILVRVNHHKLWVVSLYKTIKVTFNQNKIELQT